MHAYLNISTTQNKTTFLKKEKKIQKMEGNSRERNNDDLDFDDDVEDQEVEERSPTSSGVGGSRWNPTKEQIEMLERIYTNEGVRTPSAEQIQQITARLRVYGHIEGKNVFYWFQNHKARQRQKQRHDRLLAAAAANHNVNQISPRFIGAPPLHYHTNHGLNNGLTRPIFPASHPTYHHHHHFLPNPNVMCSPYYHMPQANHGFYNPPQHHCNAPATPVNDHHQGMKKVPSKPSISNATNHNTTRVSNKGVGVPPGSTLSGYCAAMMNDNNSKSMEHYHQYDYQGNCMGMRTLNLFPVHPTGILEHKLSGNNNSNSAGNSCATSSSSDTNINDFGDLHQHPHFIDFFSSGHASSEST